MNRKEDELKLFLAGLFAIIDIEAGRNDLIPSVDEILQGVSPIEYAVDKLNKKEKERGK